MISTPALVDHEATLTKVLVLEVPTWFSLGFDDVVGLLSQVANKNLLLSVSHEFSRSRAAACTVATDMANAALLEHWAMSSSVAMIFFTRATDLSGQRRPFDKYSDPRGKADVPEISSGDGIAALL
jgi:hypothetical protein